MKLHKLNLSAFPVIYLQLIILFSLEILCLQPTSHVNAFGSASDRLALLEFRKGIANDPYGILNQWNDSTNFCNWNGVTCSRRHQRVTTLNLLGHDLYGSISPHIGNLTFLRFIMLSNNSFYGKIPPEVGQLFRLRRLHLTNNTLTGEIPSKLFNCSELREIEISENKLAGKIPSQIGSLTKLLVLSVGRNKFTGSIPHTIGNLSSLVHFIVTENYLDASIPEDIGHLRSLMMFVIGDNNFSGKLPASLFNISSMFLIGLEGNKLSGSLPTNIGLTLPNLEWLTMPGNNFSGSIPVSLSNASNLQTIDLSENKFVGIVPRDLGKLKDLQWLGFSSNHLGSNSTDDLGFLASLTNISQLQGLVFNYNQFGGVLPTSIANLSSQLQILSFRNNQIYGTIPAALEKYTNLNELNMAGNLFTGVIPSSFDKLQNMQGMNLSSNKLSGEIPPSFGNLSQLVELDLSKNKLNGSIPPSIGNCKNLQYLDISQNNLIGAVPEEITNLSSLTLLLNLSQNSLIGNLPANLRNLKNILAMDFSENKLSGEIPTTTGDCQSLEYLNLQGNSFRGAIPSSLASLKGLTHLDLSRNKLSGNIPKDLQNLRFLLYFNASFNDLEGMLPTKGVFGNATAISVMGNKKLCGGIPELRQPACSGMKASKQRISHATKLIIIITLPVLCLLLFSFSLALYWKRKSKKMHSTLDLQLPHHPKISYKMLYDGTGGFSPNNLIGSGSFGSVYKGVLDQGENVFAIKVINLQHRGASKSFMAECMALRNIRHRNLVKIITVCSSMDYQGNDFKALVLEFMENSSLEEWLHTRERNLNFLQRLHIAMDVAYALHYLHTDCEPPIVHCDLKPSNVLLDNDMVAHVSDFGLARILQTTNGIPQNQSSTIGLKGSIGYSAPEYGMGSRASIQGDLYSFGILLLEMFTGKRPTDEIFEDGLNIHRYAKMAIPERLMTIGDPSLLQREVNVTITRENPTQMRANMEQCLHSVFEIGLACSVEPSKERMNSEEVIRQLLLVKNAFLPATTNRPSTMQY